MSEETIERIKQIITERRALRPGRPGLLCPGASTGARLRSAPKWAPRSRAIVHRCCLFWVSPPPSRRSRRPSRRPPSGETARSHRTAQATNAGLRVLRHGGTAVDAAVAVAATLGVTDPFVAGIGGGGFLVYYDARTHRVYTIDGRETTPLSAGQNLFIDPATGKPLAFPTAVTSGLSVGVPGHADDLADGAAELRHDQPGAGAAPGRARGQPRLPGDRRVPRAGPGERVPVRPVQLHQPLFLPGGQLPVVGSTFRNPALAGTYEQIGREGVGDLYGGPLGQQIVVTVHTSRSCPAPAGAAAGLDAALRPGRVRGAAGAADPGRLPRLRRLRHGHVVQRRLDDGRVAEHPVQLRPGRGDPGAGAAPLPGVDPAGVRRPQPLRRRPRFVHVPLGAVAVTGVRPAAGLPDQPGQGSDQPRRARRPVRRVRRLRPGAADRRRPAHRRREHEPHGRRRPLGRRRLLHEHDRGTRRQRDRRPRPRLPAEQRADRLRLRARCRPACPTRTCPPAESGRGRACRRRSCCATARRSSRSAPPAAPRSSPPCCRSC